VAVIIKKTGPLALGPELRFQAPPGIIDPTVAAVDLPWLRFLPGRSTSARACSAGPFLIISHDALAPSTNLLVEGAL